MLRLSILLTIFSGFPILAKNADKSKIEFCKPTLTREGQTYLLGHSLFVEGESTRDGKTIFPTNSTFAPPITHVYDFGPGNNGQFWIGCAYNSENDFFIEYVEIKNKPTRCVEVMHREHGNRVQSLTCEWKKASP